MKAINKLIRMICCFELHLSGWRQKIQYNCRYLWFWCIQIGIYIICVQRKRNALVFGLYWSLLLKFRSHLHVAFHMRMCAVLFFAIAKNSIDFSGNTERICDSIIQMNLIRIEMVTSNEMCIHWTVNKNVLYSHSPNANDILLYCDQLKLMAKNKIQWCYPLNSLWQLYTLEKRSQFN